MFRDASNKHENSETSILFVMQHILFNLLVEFMFCLCISITVFDIGYYEKLTFKQRTMTCLMFMP